MDEAGQMSTKFQLIHRLDGRTEKVCEHGVGHTVAVPSWHDTPAWWSHGCDGCCSKWKEDACS